MKKRNKYVEREKKWFSLLDAEYELRKVRKNLGWIELDKPRPAGWKAYYVLREDIANREDAHVFQFIADKFCKPVFSRRKDFKFKSKKYKRWETQRPGMRNARKDEYEKMPIELKKWFRLDYRSKKMERGHFTYLCLVPKYYFEIKKKREYITHYREHDEIIEQMDAEIEFQMRDPQLRKYSWYGKHRWGSAKWYRKYVHRKNRKAVKQQIHTADDYEGLVLKTDNGCYW